MTIDEVLHEVCTAMQPFVDRDKPNPREVDVLVAETKRLFDEQPPIMHAFVASVQAIVVAARKGWVEQ